MPFGWSTALKLQPAGYQLRDPERQGRRVRDLLNTDCVFMQYWVEIPDAATLRRYHAVRGQLHEHPEAVRPLRAPDQQPPGRHSGLAAVNDVIGDDSRIEVVLAVVFLGVCIVNTVGLMLAKFLGAAPVTGLRRALGASRKQIMHQHLVEVVLSPRIGGAVGLVARAGWAVGHQSMTYVPGPDDGPERRALADSLSHMDYRMVVLAIGISVLTGILAGMYPAWRIGRAAPASFLKAQ